jgi:hypothetical protein
MVRSDFAGTVRVHIGLQLSKVELPDMLCTYDI